jgi:enoyl-CoA hydratase/carnithine racemase
MTGHVQVEHVTAGHNDGVTTIILARPEAGNRLTNAMAAALAHALREAHSSRVIVLCGAGEDFCIGRDMAPPAPGAEVSPLEVMRDDAQPMIDLFDAFARCRAPIVAEVQGRAWGIGTVFAGIADLTLASRDASFRLGELERGIPPGIALSALIDRVPPKWLAHLVYSAESADAQAALAAGLVGRVVERNALAAAREALVQRLLGFPRDALEAVKQYLSTAPHHDPALALQYGASLLGNVLASR